MSANSALSRPPLLITGNYWVFTLIDGALRMLVLLQFYQLGYSPLDIALLFLLYEFSGVLTNLVGDRFGAKLGLNRAMKIGSGLQLVALAMLLVPASALTVAWVMAAQALSGIARDLYRASGKSAVTRRVPTHLLKGVGYALGGGLLTLWGFHSAVMVMLLVLALVWLGSLFLSAQDQRRSEAKPALRNVFSRSFAVNALSAARLCQFGARDVWFAVALPVHLASAYDWNYVQVSGFLALWIIACGSVQALAPGLIDRKRQRPPDGRSAMRWAGLLAMVPAFIAASPGADPFPGTAGFAGLPLPELCLIGGLLLFCFLFAINLSLHSAVVLEHASRDGVSLDVGVYRMANAGGRLLGVILSGWLYQTEGLGACLIASSVLLLSAAALSLVLPRHE